MTSVIARTLVLLALATTALPAQVRAEVPQLINYEGRVAVNGVNFKGSGQFKFALVDPAGSTTYWSNDGTSTGGSEPAAAVTLTVTKGRYSVLLGDTTLPNMTTVPASVFTNGDLLLRVWFNDGTHGSQLLTPDQRIAVPESPASAHASQVRSGGTAATDAWQRRVDVTGTPPAGRASPTGVWTGSEMIVWGGYNGSYLNVGGRYDPGSNDWGSVSISNALAPRVGHTAIWTGSEMIVWGGYSFVGPEYTPLNSGGRYDPASNRWTVVSINGAPAPRNGHQAVWTGSEMIVWGGAGIGGSFNTGGRYNPVGDSWTAMSTSSAPVSRTAHTAVWTGSEMIVWGGIGISFIPLNDGGRYNLSDNNWTAVSATGAPAARREHTAVWTGNKMVVWGGFDGSVALNNGGRYNPTDTGWTAVSIAAAPAARFGHTAVWTGSEMIIWGGENDISSLNTGGRYNPAGDSWTTMGTNGAPDPRRAHTAVWAGSEMIVWGGKNGFSYFNDTFTYTPDAGGFRIISIVRSGEDLDLSFPTVEGCTYTLWRSDTLVDDTWTDTGFPALTGTGAILSFTVPATTPASRFFRVQVGQ